MNNEQHNPNKPHLDLALLRSAVGPGLQVAVPESLLLLVSEPMVCKS